MMLGTKAGVRISIVFLKRSKTSKEGIVWVEVHKFGIDFVAVGKNMIFLNRSAGGGVRQLVSRYLAQEENNIANQECDMKSKNSGLVILKYIEQHKDSHHGESGRNFCEQEHHRVVIIEFLRPNIGLEDVTKRA